MRLVLTESAEADLAEIGDWIAARNPARASTFLIAIRERCERLLDAPKAFPLVPRFERSGIRRRPYGDYLIFYRVDAEMVEILHILHGARDYEALLFPEE